MRKPRRIPACRYPGCMSARSRAMTLRLDAGLAEDLAAVAAVDGLPVSDAVRAAVAAYVGQRKADAAFRRALREYVARVERLVAVPGEREV